MDEMYIEQMMTGSFVKYSVLEELIASSFQGSNATEINLYIDLNSVLKQMYSIDHFSYRYASPYEINATIINMCAHYRNFFRGLGVTTNIYLIWGLNCPTINDTFTKGYNSKFVSSYIKKKDTTLLIEENLNLLNIMCQYLPRIYFFNIGNNEVSAMIDHLIRTLNTREKGIENIIISKDVLMLQLVPAYDVRVIRPSKTKDGDLSFITDNRNLWTRYACSYRKVKEPATRISNVFFQNVLAMNRIPERSISSVLSLDKSIKLIDTGVRMGYLDPTKFYNQSTINSIISALDVTCNPTELELRFKAINAHFQALYVLLADKPNLKRLRLVDLEDPISLKEIVSKYFDRTPIDLDRL